MKDPLMYCNCMEEVKTRISIIHSVVKGSISLGRGNFFDTELVCIHLRKTLELIAFASLVANKNRYAEAHNNFERHWKAKRLLENLEEIHSEFYPRPIEFDREDEQGVMHFRNLMDGFLTRTEFVDLYDTCCEVLHTRNPFRVGDEEINFGRSIKEWTVRIQKLLAVHYMCLVDSEDLWIVYMQYPADNKVHAITASPQQAVS